jgi:hypothetical protein
VISHRVGENTTEWCTRQRLLTKLRESTNSRQTLEKKLHGRYASRSLKNRPKFQIAETYADASVKKKPVMQSVKISAEANADQDYFKCKHQNNC